MLQKNLRSKFLSFALVGCIALTTVFSAGCGFVSDLKIALASSGPLVTILVNKGVISQAKADFIRQDFGDAVDVVAVLDAKFKVAAGVPEKLAAAQQAETSWRAIYERGHFGVNPAVLDAANIADAIFATIVAYYGGRPVSLSVSAKTAPKTEKALAETIKAKIKELKEKLKVQ